MNSLKVILGTGFVLCLLLVVESKDIEYNSNSIRQDCSSWQERTSKERNGVFISHSHTDGRPYEEVFTYSKRYRQKEYYWVNHPILALGVENFLSYAAHFCKYETENGTLEVVSVGSGRGNVENDIIEAYTELFGAELRITLVDPNPACRVDFQTVDDLIAKRADAVRNCILLVIWPELEQRNDGHDIQAIRRLQPRAVLTMYEITGLSGSLEFLACLHPPGFRYAHGVKCTRRLNNYVIEEIAYQEVNCSPGPAKMWNCTWDIPAGVAGLTFRLVKLERTD